MTKPLTLTIATGREKATITGSDTTILRLPPSFYVPIDDGPPALDVRALSHLLRQLAEQQAADLNEALHHAEFVITRDPAVIEARGVLHDCEDCRAGVRQALRYIREHPEDEMIVGTLYWAQSNGS